MPHQIPATGLEAAVAAIDDIVAGGEALPIGLEAFIPPNTPIAAGHNVVNVGYGRLEAGG